MPHLKTFIYDNIEYTYYFNGSTPFLGSDTNQKSAIDRSIDGTLSLPNFINDGDKLYPLEYLSAYSFYACSLSHLTLPNTVKGIAGGSFESMRNLISIDLSQCKITYIPGFLFSNAVQLETILLPPTIESIGNYSFQNVQKVKFLTISPKLQSIHQTFCPSGSCGIETVFYCGSFDNGLTLPDTVTHVIVPRNYQGETFSNIKVNRTASLCVYNVKTCYNIRRSFNFMHAQLISFMIFSLSYKNSSKTFTHET